MKPELKKDALIFLGVFGGLTLPFLVFPDLDILLQQPYFSATEGWFMATRPFWDFIYKYSIFLGYLLAIAALALISLSYWRKALYPWRKAAFFMLFVVAIGPGVLVNSTFKDHWGRPRPRDIQEFQGTENFVLVWQKGHTEGKSFPCGHASIAFYLSIPFLFLRQRYKKWAWVFFISGTLYGLLVGYTRMLAGGHFASDVIWAAGMVWFTGIVGYHLFRLDKEVDAAQFDPAARKKQGKVVTVLMGLIVPALTVSLLLATPYLSDKQFTADAASLQKDATQSIVARLPEGKVQLHFEDDFQASYKVSAFGFPNSKIRYHWQGGSEASYTINYMGWFTEVRNNFQMSFPANPNIENTLNLGKGDITLTLKADSLPNQLSIELEEGDVHLFTQDCALHLETDVPALKDLRNGATHNPDAPKNIYIHISEGSLTVE